MRESGPSRPKRRSLPEITPIQSEARRVRIKFGKIMQGVSELSAKVLATKLAEFRKLNRQITQLGTLISLPANIIHDFREVMVQSPAPQARYYGANSA